MGSVLQNHALPADYFETIEAGATEHASPDRALAAFLATDGTSHGMDTQDRLKLPWGGINPSGLIGPPSDGLRQRFADIKASIFGGSDPLALQRETFLRANVAEFFTKTEFRREDFE